MAAEFDHSGIYLKTEALGKYEQYLGNEYAADKGLAPRLGLPASAHRAA